MIMETVAPILFGAQIGAWGFHLISAKFAKPTYAQTLGADILASAERARFKLRFAPGCVVTQSFTLIKSGEPDVQITLSATRPDFEEIAA